MPAEITLRRLLMSWKVRDMCSSRHVQSMCSFAAELNRNNRSNDHLLFNLLPPTSTSSQNYDLRTRSHSQQLHQRTGHLTDSNFLQKRFSKTLINIYHVNFHRFYLSPIVMKLRLPIFYIKRIFDCIGFHHVQLLFDCCIPFSLKLA